MDRRSSRKTTTDSVTSSKSRKNKSNENDISPSSQKSRGRKSPIRRSPVAARKSPVRKSPARKSPVRKSPVRKSPARKTPLPKIEKPPASLTNQATIKPLNESHPMVSLPTLRLSPIDHKAMKNDTKSVTTQQISTETYTRIKVSNLSEATDGDLLKISGDLKDNIKIQNFLNAVRLTPTPSEHSRQRSISRSISHSFVDEPDNRSGSEYSDHEDESTYGKPATLIRNYINDCNYDYKRRSETKQMVLQEFGGSIGSLLLLILIPSTIFYLIISCTRKQCALNGKWDELKLLSTYFSLNAFYIYFTLTWTVILCSAIPFVIGRTVQLRTERGLVEYFFNGFSTAVLIFIGLGVIEYTKYLPIFKMIRQNYQQLCFISILHGLITSVWCYGRSAIYVQRFYWNPHASSGKFLYDLFVGREINPKWFNIFDIKQIYYRISLISLLIFNALFLSANLKFNAMPKELIANISRDGNISMNSLKELAQHAYPAQYDTVAVLLTTLLIIYVLDLLLFEHHLIGSFDLHYEGVGAMLLIRYAIFPFTNSLIAKYAVQHRITNVPVWAIILTAFIFLFGLFLKRRSNKLKYEYRVDNMNPRFKDLETLATYQGRRLIACSYWGLLRQPNYLGDILSALSLLIPLYWKFAWPPLITTLFTVVLLLHRAKRVDERNRNRYNAAWTRYCSRVRYMIVPKLY